MEKLKKCFDCKRILELSQYVNNKHRKDGKSHCCRQCTRRRTKEYYGEYPEKRTDKWLKTRYGITIDDYKRMYSEQNGKCYICKTDKAPSKFKRFSVDHCHKSGKVRGLLCRNCNLILGGAKDSEEILLNCIEYLKKHKTGDN